MSSKTYDSDKKYPIKRAVKKSSLKNIFLNNILMYNSKLLDNLL